MFYFFFNDDGEWLRRKYNKLIYDKKGCIQERLGVMATEFHNVALNVFSVITADTVVWYEHLRHFTYA